eukprot:3099170-Amphidinium_carterae.1
MCPSDVNAHLIPFHTQAMRDYAQQGRALLAIIDDDPGKPPLYILTIYMPSGGSDLIEFSDEWLVHLIAFLVMNYVRKYEDFKFAFDLGGLCLDNTDELEETLALWLSSSSSGEVVLTAFARDSLLVRQGGAKGKSSADPVQLEPPPSPAPVSVSGYGFTWEGSGIVQSET